MFPTTGSPTITVLRLSNNYHRINITFCNNKAIVLNININIYKIKQKSPPSKDSKNGPIIA